MNILLVHQYYMTSMNVGGGARWNEMTRFWAEQGHKITVIAGTYCFTLGCKNPQYKGKIFKKEILDSGIEVIRVHTSSKYDKNYFWRAWAYISFILLSTLAVILYARRRYDVVLASSPPLTVGPLGVLLAKVKRAPFVFEVRDLWPESAIDTGVVTNPTMIKIMYWMEKISYKHAKAINALTPAFRRIMIEKKKLDPNKIWMIPNAADFDLMKPGPIDNEIRKQHGWDGKFVGLYIGAHGRANHLWQLIETAKLLRNEPEYMIVCVGNGMDRDALIEKARVEGLTNIHFLPSVGKNEVCHYLNACNVSLIVLRKVDTFKTVYPNKMFDSMATAKPIILAIDGVARELVVDQAKCGRFVEPENAEQIATAMRYYHDHSEESLEQGQKGYEYVRNHYDRRKLAGQYIDLIQQHILEGKKE